MTPELLAIKAATSEMIKGCGGLEASASFCRVGKSALGEYQSINKSECFAPLDVVLDLEPLARARDGWPHVTTALCRAMGGTFVALPEVPLTTSGIHLLLGDLSKEFAEATSAVCT